MAEDDLKASISGSFDKFKPEIDLAIDEMTDLGVTVLSPEKGWLYKPPQRIYNPSDDKFRPLPSEKGIGPKEIEDEFLASVKKSDFLYVINLTGYVGETVCLEIGYAIAKKVPVFLKEEISPLIMESSEAWLEIKPKLKVCSIKDAINEVKSSRK